MKTSDNDNNRLDNRLRHLLLESEKPLAPDPWFVRRVINRLPARRERRLLSLPELTAFIMVVAVCGMVIAVEMRSVMSLTVGAAFDPSKMIVAAAMAAVATLYVAIPVVRRALH